MATAGSVLRIAKIGIVITTASMLMTETLVTAAMNCRAFGNVHTLECEFKMTRFKERRKL
jgi:hypothetical protein